MDTPKRKCKDCGTEFTTVSNPTQKCEACRDRDRAWEERGIQDEMRHGMEEL